ncbi:flagellar assembly protein A [Rugamonas brunnea]|uniref:flagellar assembly protein A n=1 Tax=Rugamonas brunnea TaxID=2758569 RepID=UPI002882E253|nr:flagellar assembly protein A [Rugamonas brunnea]
MSDDALADDELADDGLPSAVVRRPDGVYFRADAQAVACQAAVNQVFLSSACFAGLDYSVFIRVLYNCGPALPQGLQNQALIRFADDVQPFPSARRELYKAVRIVHGEAEYYFEPVFLEVPDAPPQPARLDFGEFVADMWVKGIRFGIDAPAVKAVIASGKAARIVAARRLDPTPGVDAAFVEVSRDIHRSNAPREMADGRLDWHTFQNRFPQVKAHTRLLRKVPRVAGVRGYELSGIVIEPPPPRDIELSTVAGTGTVIEHQPDGEYLVAAVEGFLHVDPSSKRISIGPKIISREGVSARTTGNLQLAGEYEEFGEVQEQRTVEGGSITIHGDVFGKISSRGGTIVLHRNLVGGSAVNANGDIRMKGVASGAVLQTKNGEITVARAENCVISGTRVLVGEAVNCEIIGDDVMIKLAIGCAVAGRKIDIASAGPRKQSEMLVFALVPDTSKYDFKLAELGTQLARHEREAAQRKNEMDGLTGQTEVRNYLTLATRVRKHEVVLTPEQEQLFHKMAGAVGPTLKAVAKLSLALKAEQVRQEQVREQMALVERQKQQVMRGSRCVVRLVDGDVTVRSMVFNPDLGPLHDSAPKAIKAMLRTTGNSRPVLFSGSSGAVDWALGE